MKPWCLTICRSHKGPPATATATAAATPTAPPALLLIDAVAPIAFRAGLPGRLSRRCRRLLALAIFLLAFPQAAAVAGDPGLEGLRAAFSEYDADGSGYVASSRVEEILERAGHDASSGAPPSVRCATLARSQLLFSRYESDPAEFYICYPSKCDCHPSTTLLSF